MSGRPSASRAERLIADAAEAARMRAYQTHPDVVALQVERIRRVVDRLVWTAVLLGLLFTMTNVQLFAARGAQPWSAPWVIAWLLDPMVSLVVIGILLAESVTSRWQVHTGGWVRVAKWASLGATYAMNTWSAWSARDVASIVLHSVPPLTVLVAAEAITDLRDRLTEAVLVAGRRATTDSALASAHHPGLNSALPETAPDVVASEPMSAGGWSAAEPALSGASAVSAQPARLDGTATHQRLSASEATEPLPEVALAEVLRSAPPGPPPQTPGTVTTPKFLAPPLSTSLANAAVEAGWDERADANALMRAYWDHHVEQGRIPTGAELAAAGGVSPATGKRRRAQWENELTAAGGL